MNRVVRARNGAGELGGGEVGVGVRVVSLRVQKGCGMAPNFCDYFFERTWWRGQS